MRTLNVKNMSVEVFADIYEFSTALLRPANKVCASRTKYSAAQGQSEFYGTESYDVADNLLRNGYKEGATALATKRQQIGQREMQKQLQSSPVGFAPNVPNVLMGKPYGMFNYKQAANGKPVVHIIYNISVGCTKTSEMILTAARKLFAAINALERSGVRCALSVGEMSWEHYRSKEEYVGYIVGIKRPDAPLNPMKVAYPMVHPSFFRRHGFRWLETCPAVTMAKWPENYGISVKEKDKFVEAGAIQPTDAYFSYYSLERMTEEEILADIKRQTNAKNN